MSPRTVEQYEQIRAEKRALIMDAAIKVFAEKTFQGASVSMIAKEAGISKGLLYNYFESKEELLVEIIKTAASNIYESFDPNHDGVLTKEEFFFFIKENFKGVKNNLPFWKLYTMIILQPSVIELVEHDFDEVSGNYMKLVYELFNRSGIEDAEGEMLLFTSMLKGGFMQYIAAPDLFPIDLFEEKLIKHYDNKLKD